MNEPAMTSGVRCDPTAGKSLIAKWRESNARRASWRLANTMGSCVVVWVLYYYNLSVSW